MMKGDEEPEMTIGAIIFVVAIGFVLLIVFMGLADYDTAITSNQETMAAISEAHRAMECMKAGAAFAAEPDITESNIESCNIIDYQVCIRDIESGKSWMDCDMVNPDHTTYLAIKYDGKINMVRLYVKKT